MTYDVAIVGSGFASSILARILAAGGRRVLMVEKGEHPRFALGESSTPLGNLCLERLADRWGLADLRSLATRGRWLERHPDLDRGLKRGFTFWFHHAGEAFDAGPGNRNRLLVAASPEDELSDSHWLRSDVDEYLARRAQSEGVELRERAEVVSIRRHGGRFEVEIREDDRTERVRTDFLVDGSGRAGVVSDGLGVDLLDRPARFESSLVYSHFGDVAALGRTVPGLEPGPYPDERAAVHHLLDEGWVYALRFDSGIVSAGLVWVDDPDGARAAWAGTTPEEQWRHVTSRYPTLREQFAGAVPIRPIDRLPRLQYRRSRAGGDGWAPLPNAYAFFEPLFSTGIAWSLLAVERLADLLLRSGSREERDLGLIAHLERIEREADQIERLVYGAYLARRDPELFAAQSFLYFAAVSFEETRQRMLPEPAGGPPPGGFLGAGDTTWEGIFASSVRRLEESDRAGFGQWVEETIRPWNIAGLASPRRRNLYPVEPRTVVERAELLGLSREEATRRLPLLRGQRVPLGDTTTSS